MRAGLVSVVLPTYNRAYCLPATLASLLNQTYQDLEVVVCDDGSTDGTRELVEQQRSRDGRVKCVAQSNRGVSAARNTAIRATAGEFIAFCDSDDLWAPWKLEVQVACMRAFPSAGLSWTDLSATDPEGKILYERYTRVGYKNNWELFAMDRLFRVARKLADVDGKFAQVASGGSVYMGDIFSAMIAGTIVNMPTVMVRRTMLDRVGLFDESMIAGEDYDFNLRMCAEAPAVFVDAPAAAYRVGAPDQLTRPALMVEQARNSLRTVAPFLETQADRIELPGKKLKQILAGRYRWLGETELDAGHRAAGRRALLQSLRRVPSQTRLWALLAMSFVPAPAGSLMRAAYRKVKALSRRD